jgi:hypothetical protein
LINFNLEEDWEEFYIELLSFSYTRKFQLELIIAKIISVIDKRRLEKNYVAKLDMLILIRRLNVAFAAIYNGEQVSIYNRK